MDCSLPSSSIHGDSLGKNTGVGCHSLLQGIFLTQGLNLHFLRLLRCRWILYHWAIAEALYTFIHAQAHILGLCLFPEAAGHKIRLSGHQCYLIPPFLVWPLPSLAAAPISVTDVSSASPAPCPSVPLSAPQAQRNPRECSHPFSCAREEPPSLLTPLEPPSTLPQRDCLEQFPSQTHSWSILIYSGGFQTKLQKLFSDGTLKQELTMEHPHLLWWFPN